MLAQDVAKEVLAFAEMTGDAPVAHQADAYDFPHLPQDSDENDPFSGSPVLAALPNGSVSPYRCGSGLGECGSFGRRTGTDHAGSGGRPHHMTEWLNNDCCHARVSSC